jgi:hypothetical protein
MRKEERDVRLADVVLDPKYYPRVNHDWSTVCRYQEAMLVGEKFPAVHLVPIGDGKYMLLDGWHRVLAARHLKWVSFKAIVYKGLPEKKWLAVAVKLNIANSRQLTAQDRAMVASRLKAAGYDIAAIAKLVNMAAATVTEWIITRTAVDENGVVCPVKAALRSLVGTEGEGGALEHGGPIANANVRRTLDEMLALLKAKAVNVHDKVIRGKVVEIRAELVKLLKAARAT